MTIISNKGEKTLVALMLVKHSELYILYLVYKRFWILTAQFDVERN